MTTIHDPVQHYPGFKSTKIRQECQKNTLSNDNGTEVIISDYYLQQATGLFHDIRHNFVKFILIFAPAILEVLLLYKNLLATHLYVSNIRLKRVLHNQMEDV